MSYRMHYGNRMGPGSWDTFAPKILSLLQEKNVVSFKDMQKATGKKWVRGFLSAVNAQHPVVPVKDGRAVIGYRLADKPLEMSKNGTSFRGPDGRWVAVAAAKAKKPATSKKRVKKDAVVAPEVTAENVASALASETLDPVFTPETQPDTGDVSLNDAPHKGESFVPETPAESARKLADLERPAPVVPVTSNEDGLDVPAFLRKS
jgi:hypothetical protein